MVQNGSFMIFCIESFRNSIIVSLFREVFFLLLSNGMQTLLGLDVYVAHKPETFSLILVHEAQ